jgi:general secretion pathway protein B
MSYILEALKKSDQERQKGAAPNLQTLQVAPVHEPESTRRWWPYLLLIGLLLNAGVIVWWMNPWQATNNTAAPLPPTQQQAQIASQPAETQASSPVKTPSVAPVATVEEKTAPTNEIDEKKVSAAQPASEPSTARQETASRQDPPSPPAADLQQRASLKTPAPVEPRNPSFSSAVQKESPAARPVDPPNKAIARAKETEMPAIPPAVTTQNVKQMSAPKADLPPLPKAEPQKKASVRTPEMSNPVSSSQAENLALSRPEKQAPPPAEEIPPRPPKLSESSLSSIDGLPKLSLSFLVYSKNPPDRMVSINGRMVREGQEVSAGLKLEEIAPDGVIFNYKGYRFRKGVF